MLLFISLSVVCMYMWGFTARQLLRSLAPVMRGDDNDVQIIFGDLVGLKLPDICPTGEEKPRKTSPKKLVPKGVRTRAHCARGAHASACPTAVDPFFICYLLFPYVGLTPHPGTYNPNARGNLMLPMFDNINSYSVICRFILKFLNFQLSVIT